jgi:aconitase A
MNKIALSLIALAALSTASFAAGNRNWDLRDSPDIAIQYAASGNSVNAFGAAGTATSNFERLQLNQMTNESSSHAG